MKKIIYLLLSVFTATVLLNSCVKDSNYDTAQITCDFDEAALTGEEISFDAVIGMYSDEPILWDADYPNYISGYVVSSDETGNFYKEIYLQDDPENPTKAIKLSVNKKTLFAKYNMGRKVYVYLAGLAFEKNRGEYMLGLMEDDEVNYMTERTMHSNIYRNCEAVDVVAKNLGSPSAVSDADVGMFVQFDNMQFDNSLITSHATYVAPGDLYDSHVPLMSVNDGSIIMIETSTYANFGAVELNANRGSIQGVLSRNYSDDFYVLKLNNLDDVMFEEERFNPNYVYEEDFESYAYDDTSFGGWTNINANGGSTLFTVKAYGGTQYLQGAAYGSGEDPLEMWAVTPAITLTAGVAERFLSFKTKTGYNNGAALSAYISTDFAGDVTTATWVPLTDAVLADGPSSGYETSFTSSGPLDITSYSGDIYVAFKYEGGTGGITTTFQIDDVAVIEN